MYILYVSSYTDTCIRTFVAVTMMYMYVYTSYRLCKLAKSPQYTFQYTYIANDHTAIYICNQCVVANDCMNYICFSIFSACQHCK